MWNMMDLFKFKRPSTKPTSPNVTKIIHPIEASHSDMIMIEQTRTLFLLLIP